MAANFHLISSSHRSPAMSKKNKTCPSQEIEQPLLDLYNNAEVFDFSRIPDHSKGVEPFGPEVMAEMDLEATLQHMCFMSEILNGTCLKCFHEDLVRIIYFQGHFWHSYEGDLGELRCPEPHSPSPVESRKILTNHRHTLPGLRLEVRYAEPCINPSLLLVQS